jgi:uncharacterized protein YegP (UPF0339 family)
MIFTRTAEIIQDEKGNYRVRDNDGNIYNEEYSSRQDAIAGIKGSIDNAIELNETFDVADTQYNHQPAFTHYKDENGNEIAATDTVFFEEDTDETQILMFDLAERATPSQVH